MLWLWWRDTPFVERTPAALLTGAGRISGLAAGYVIALVVLLMSRLPVLERRVGSDRVTRWHTLCGRYAVGLVVVHVALVLAGYAAQERTGLVEQAWSVWSPPTRRWARPPWARRSCWWSRSSPPRQCGDACAT